MNARWICPQCGDGVLAPQRPRKNDVRRYCLECSKTTGRLVERRSPRLEAKRASSKVRSAEKRREEKARSRDYYLVAGIDAEKLMRTLAVLPVFGGRKGKVYERVTSPHFALEIERGSHGRRKLGHCAYWRIKLHTTPEWNETTLREVLLHELMHIHVPSQRLAPKKVNLFGKGRVRRIANVRHHTPLFHRKMKIAWRQAAKRLGACTVVGPHYGRWIGREGIRDHIEQAAAAKAAANPSDQSD